MARKYLTPIDLTKLELQNAAMHNLPSAPSSPVKGQIYMNTTDNILYWWNGTAWVSAAGGGSSFPGYGSVPAETTFGIARADGVATTVARSDHTHGSPTHDAAAHSTIPRSALATPTADMSMGGFRLTNVGTPTAGTDATNKDYVDNLVAGIAWKDPVRCATTAAGTLATSYAAGQVVDGVTLATGNRILIKNQIAPGSENGIYTVNATGAPTRATDADTGPEMEAAAVFVMEGTTLGDTAWVCTTNAPITIGTTNLSFAQFANVLGAYTAGNGLLQAGMAFNVVAANGSIVVGADDIQVGYAGTGGALGAAVTAARSDHTHTGMTRKFAGTVAAATSTVINHALNTRDVIVDVYRTATPWDSVECDVERTDANNVTVRFAVAPAAGEYQVVVIG